MIDLACDGFGCDETLLVELFVTVPQPRLQEGKAVWEVRASVPRAAARFRAQLCLTALSPSSFLPPSATLPFITHPPPSSQGRTDRSLVDYVKKQLGSSYKEVRRYSITTDWHVSRPVAQTVSRGGQRSGGSTHLADRKSVV